MGSGSLWILFYLPFSSPGWRETRVPAAAWHLAGAGRALPRWCSGLAQGLLRLSKVFCGLRQALHRDPKVLCRAFPKAAGALSGECEAFPRSAWAPRVGAGGLQASPRLYAKLFQVLHGALSCGMGCWQALCQAPKVLLRALPGTAGDSEAALGGPKLSWDSGRQGVGLSWYCAGLFQALHPGR